jgi:uroporphyrinogen-III synthase
VSLDGKRILVTRAAEDAEEFEQLLRQRGATPVRFPCIAFEDGPDLGRIREAVAEDPDFIVVSSPHAARRLLGSMGRTSARFAAVGDATARLLPGEPIVPAEGAGADALLKVLKPLVRGKRVLVPRAEQGTPALVEGLQAAGALVEVRVLYKTITPRSADLSALRGIDAIAFASGSAVRGFVKLAGVAEANRQPVACIGASTAAEARKAGIRVDACAEGGLAELCDALALAVPAGKG